MSNKDRNSPLVSIDCITYNQEDFIRHTLDGFLMQKTDFTFEILIHDDASTDNTPKIIQEYVNRFPELIKPILQKENQYTKNVGMSVTFQYPRAKGKYIAYCEGDDYWTDPYKLQKQVDFLEAHPDYGLVYTEVDSLSDESGEIKKDLFKNILGIKTNTFENFIINTWWLATCTWMFRLDIYEKNKCLQNKKYQVGDLPLLLTISKNSKVHFLEESTAVYRVLNDSASHHTSIQDQFDFLIGLYRIQMDYANHYKINLEIITKIKCMHFSRILDIACIENNTELKLQAFKYLKQFDKLNLKNYILYYISKISPMRLIVKNMYLKKLQVKKL